MNVHESINQLIDEFKELKTDLQEHIEFNEELLPHVFFGDCNYFFIKLIKEENPIVLKRLFHFFERMATDGDDYVRNVLTVSILEVLSDDKKVLNNAYNYMGNGTRRLSDEIEKFLGRY